MIAPGELRDTTVYLDSNVFIYALEALGAPAHSAAVRLLEDIHAQAYDGATSLLTRTEVLVRPL